MLVGAVCCSAWMEHILLQLETLLHFLEGCSVRLAEALVERVSALVLVFESGCVPLVVGGVS